MSRRHAVIEFLAAVFLLGFALLCAIGSELAIDRGDRTLGIALAVVSLLIASCVTFVFVPRLARRIDFSRWNLPQSFRVTREGGLFILVIFLIALAAFNTGNNLLFLILSLSMSMILVSGSAARWTLRALSISLQVPENVYEGERVSVKVSLHNLKRFFPAFSILVEDASLTRQAGKPASPGGRRPRVRWLRRLGLKERQDVQDRSVLRHPAYFPVVPPREQRAELVPQFYPRRGRYQLQGFRLSTRFPFGFFRRGERVAASGEILVYPQVRELSDYLHLLPFLPGRLEGSRPGPGETLYAIRRYQDGDGARLVDWKATAKRGELMVREHAREEETKFCLILDTIIHPGSPPDAAERFERAVSVAASLFEHFCGEGAEMEFVTPEEHIPRGMGPAQLNRVLRSLAVVECVTGRGNGDPGGPRADPTAVEDHGTSTGASGLPDLRRDLRDVLEDERMAEILSAKVFKIILTSRPRGTLPSAVWQSSHVIYFDEL